MGYCVKNQNDHPSKNRVWDFFSGGECCAGDFQLQVVEVHQEKEGVATTIASGRVEHYQYDPFGNIIHLKDFDTTGIVHDNPYRFSTKFTDDETDLVYYGFRFYNPNLGRWINRDPIGEKGGLNIISFILNNSINYADYLGLDNSPGGGGNNTVNNASCPCKPEEVDGPFLGYDRYEVKTSYTLNIGIANGEDDGTAISIPGAVTGYESPYKPGTQEYSDNKGKKLGCIRIYKCKQKCKSVFRDEVCDSWTVNVGEVYAAGDTIIGGDGGCFLFAGQEEKAEKACSKAAQGACGD